MKPVKWQRNAIFEAVEEGGLDPRECTFDYDDDEARITYGSSYLILEGGPTKYMAKVFVGEGPEWPYEMYIWPKVEERVRRWSEEVKRDVETPDL